MGMFEELRRRPPDGLKAQQSRRVDYACGGWFLETAWLHAFFREPRGTTVTGEDMHLSYTAHKYLGVETFAVRFRRDQHPDSSYAVLGTEETTTTPAMFALRSDLVHDMMGSGAALPAAVKVGSLVFLDSVEKARAVLSRLSCLRERSCSPEIVGPVIPVFAKLGKRDIELQQAAKEICSATSCAFIPTETCHPMCDSLRPFEFFELEPGKYMGSYGTTSLVSGDLLSSAVALIVSARPRMILVAAQQGLIRSVAFEAAAFAAVPGLVVHELV
mmetsp:Transcript_114583/g.262959  ORF Transcript_114583/g.262959 Transcript_114583/m.262959 type:complete len:273 (+) Transcript_114583:540-1358(+)